MKRFFVNQLVIAALVIAAAFTSCDNKDDEDKPTSHTITVSSGGNGTASANVTSAVKDETITLSATANSGYRFAEWQVIEGGVTLSSTTDNPATFKMPDNTVEVKATFLPDDAGKHTITVSSDENGTASASVTSAKKDETITITATANNGYRFAEWQVIEGDISLSDETDNPATFKMPDRAVEVKAIFVIAGPLLESIYMDGELWREFEYDHLNRMTKITEYAESWDENEGKTIWKKFNTKTLTYNGEGDLDSYEQENFLSTWVGTYLLTRSGNKILFNEEQNLGYGEEYVELNGELPVKYIVDFSSTELDGLRRNTRYYVYEYQNGNLMKLTREDKNYLNEIIIWEDNDIVIYTYDDKKSPFYNCKSPKWWFVWQEMGGSWNMGAFQNNVLTVQYNSTNPRTITNTYTYDNAGFPQTMKRVNSSSSWSSENTFTYKYK